MKKKITPTPHSTEDIPIHLKAKHFKSKSFLSDDCPIYHALQEQYPVSNLRVGFRILWLNLCDNGEDGFNIEGGYFLDSYKHDLITARSRNFDDTFIREIIIHV